jgi:HSP20 family protein
MFLTKFKPNALDTVFDTDFFPMWRTWSSEEGNEGCRLPKTNVNETEKSYVLTVEMPGVDKKHVGVAVENDYLIISGEKTEKIRTEGLLRSEIRSEKFRRSFRLDAKVDRDNIKAALDAGVLTVTLPKVEKAVGRQIEIA